MTSPGTLKIETPREDRALVVGFELYLAHTQLFKFKNSDLVKYSMDDVVEARNNTTGSPKKIIEWIQKNCSLNKREVSGDISCETTKSHSVTTDPEYKYYDKHGQCTQQNMKHPPVHNVGPHVEIRRTDSILPNIPSSPYTHISDDQLYGDETDGTSLGKTEGPSSHYEKHSNDNGTSQWNEHVNDHKSVYNTVITNLTGNSHLNNEQLDDYHDLHSDYISMPAQSSKGQQVCSDIKSRDDLHIGKYLHDPNIKPTQIKQVKIYNPSKQESGPLGDTCFVESALVQGKPVKAKTLTCHEELKIDNMYIHREKDSSSLQVYPTYDDKYPSEMATVQPNLAGLLSPKTVEESLLKEGERVVKILGDRLEAGEKSLSQKQSLPKHFPGGIIATDISEQMPEKQCNICSGIAIVGCEKCKMAVCRDCLKILKKRPCMENDKHDYKILAKLDSLHLKENSSAVLLPYESAGSWSSFQQEPPQADVKKWQCKHCTCLNSFENSVCVACCRTKDVTVQRLNVGDWECSICSLVNPESMKYCKICKSKKEKFKSTVV